MFDVGKQALTTLFDAAKDPSAAAGALAERVSGLVEQGLNSSAGLVIQGILKLVKLDDLPGLVRGRLDKIKELAQKPLSALLEALAKPVKKILRKVTGGDTEATPPVLAEDGKTLLWVERDKKTGDYQIWKNASPDETVGDEFSKAAKGRIAKAVDDVLDAPKGPREQLVAAMRKLASELKKEHTETTDSADLLKNPDFADLARQRLKFHALEPEKIPAKRSGKPKATVAKLGSV